MGCRLTLRGVLFLMVVALSSSLARAETSTDEYAAGHFAKVLPAVKSELSSELVDSSAFLTRLRLATNAFAQDSSISLAELQSIYDAAMKPAEKFGYAERVTAERASVSEWMALEGKADPAKVLAGLNQAIAIPKESLEKIRERSSRIFAMGILARRAGAAKGASPEWLFVAGKALDADTESGQLFFEGYLSRSDGKKLEHRVEALKLLEARYREEYGSKLPADVAQRLKEFKKQK